MARAGDVPAAPLVREAAAALAAFAYDPMELLTACKQLIERRPACGPLVWVAARMLTGSDPSTEAWDAVDALEEGVFLATLADARLQRLPTSVREGIARLAEEVVCASQEHNKALDAAQHVHRGGARADVEDFFLAFQRVVELEHHTDASERAITAALAGLDGAAGAVLVAARLSASLEAAADTLSHCVHILHDYLVDEVMSV